MLPRYALAAIAMCLPSCDAFGATDDGADVTDTFGAPVVLASGEITPRGVAVDDREVFWASEDGGEIRATTKTGGQGVRLVARAHRGGPRDIALDYSTVYWTETHGDCCSAGILRAPKAGGADRPASLLGSSLGQVARRMSLQDRTIYATVQTYTDGESAVSVAADGSASPLFLARGEPTALGAIVTTGPFVFWAAAAGTKIVRVEKPDGAQFDFATKQAGVEDMVTDGSVIYWGTNGGALWSLTADRPGQPPTQLASGLSAPQRLVLQGEHLYFLQADGGIARVPKAGGAPQRLATLAGARALAVDATGVFVTTDPGDVFKIPRSP